MSAASASIGTAPASRKASQATGVNRTAARPAMAAKPNFNMRLARLRAGQNNPIIAMASPKFIWGRVAQSNGR